MNIYTLFLTTFTVLGVVLSYVSGDNITLSTLETKFKNLDEKQRAMETKIKQLEEERDSWKSTVKYLINEITYLKEQPHVGAIERNKRQSNDKVAFSARLTHDLTHLGAGQGIVFDEEISDYGHNYDPTDGVFIAPLSGYYVFTWTTATRQDRNQVTTLVKNGREIGYSISNASDNDDAQVTNTVVTTVKAGEHVFVRTGSDHKYFTSTHVLERDNCNTFSGWLLFETF